jgi:hypothetical protein
MVSKNPRTPNRSFVIKHAGKKITVYAQSHVSGIGEVWGAQVLCPWGCNAKFLITNALSPARVKDEMTRAIKSHYEISHKK